MIPNTVASYSFWRIGFNFSPHLEGGRTFYLVWHDRKNRVFKGWPLLRIKYPLTSIQISGKLKVGRI